MEASVNGQKYLIQFRYPTERSSNCRIITEDGHAVGFGEATRNPNDNPCKETARKLTLTRALKNFSKEQRKPFWDAYLNRKQKQALVL